jgi:cytosine/uracil/thiamine/allantoin permease
LVDDAAHPPYDSSLQTTLPDQPMEKHCEQRPQAAPLWNEDLAPTTAAQRTWRWYHFAALWVGMVMCIPAYTLSASLIEGGHVGYQAVLTVFLANAIVLLPMLADRPRRHQVRHSLRGAGAPRSAPPARGCRR